MKNRTKFTILAAVMIFLLMPVQIVLSVLSKEMLSDTFCTVWISAWTVELAILAGIKITSDKNTNPFTMD